MAKAATTPKKTAKSSPRKRIPFEFHRGNAMYAAAAAAVGYSSTAAFYTTDTSTATINNPTAVGAATAIVGAARLNTNSVYTSYYFIGATRYKYYCFFTNDGLVVILSSDGVLYDTCRR